MTEHAESATSEETGRQLTTKVTIEDVIGETLINVERLEGDVGRVKQRLLELLELTSRTNL